MAHHGLVEALQPVVSRFILCQLCHFQDNSNFYDRVLRKKYLCKLRKKQKLIKNKQPHWPCTSTTKIFKTQCLEYSNQWYNFKALNIIFFRSVSFISPLFSSFRWSLNTLLFHVAFSPSSAFRFFRTFHIKGSIVSWIFSTLICLFHFMSSPPKPAY